MNEKPKEKTCRLGQITQALFGIIAISSTATINRLDQKVIAELAMCIKSDCAHWRELDPEHSREDHSGGKEAIYNEGARTKRIPRREGPPGSLGHWILDATGYCGLGGKP